VTILSRSIAKRETARAKMMGSKKRITLLVEGTTDALLFEGFLDKNNFAVTPLKSYLDLAEQEIKGGVKKRIIEEVSRVYSGPENPNHNLLGFVDMDADSTKHFMFKVIVNFLDRNKKHPSRKELIKQRVKDSRGETCTFGFLNQIINGDVWNWIMQIPCLRRNQITSREFEELISVARFRSYIHALKQNNYQKTKYQNFEFLWDYTNPNFKKMRNEVYVQNFPKYDDWRVMSLKHQNLGISLNDHCLEWTIFDLLNADELYSTTSKICSKKESIVKQLNNEMMKNIAKFKKENNPEIAFRKMYNLN
jgi:hypothetical protein